MAYKLPPPLKTAITIASIILLDYVFPIHVLDKGTSISLASIVCFTGFSVMLVAAWQFVSIKTTVNPYTPEKTSSIVTTGIYGVSRNPMYLGMALIILAAAVYTSNPLAVFPLIFFIANINRTQIKPEELVLREKFGEAYKQYCIAVRRWV